MKNKKQGRVRGIKSAECGWRTEDYNFKQVGQGMPHWEGDI